MKMDKYLNQKRMGNYIEFKYITALNLNILGKDNIICVSLVNAIMYLNSIGKFNVPNL